MKESLKKFSILILLSVMINPHFFSRQESVRKGKVEHDDGIKVIKNPREPLYGEIVFELEEDLSIGNDYDQNCLFFRIRDIEVDMDGNIYVLDSGNHRIQKFNEDGDYLQTIGRRGQGPGEFELPFRLQLDEKNRNIYVNDRLRKIKIFDKEGNYLNKDIILREGLLIDFHLDSDKNIWGKLSWPRYSSFKKISHKGKVEKELGKFSFKITKKKLGRSGMIAISHGYEHDLFINKIDDQTFIFGYSKEYKLDVIDKEGNILFKIRKDEPDQKITKKERDRIIRESKMEAKSRGRSLPPGISWSFPEYMPFFYSVFTDYKGRIYVQKSPRHRRNEKGIRKFDIFSKEGYYLYKTALPYHLHKIKNGYFYTYIVNEDTGEELVKRFRIKNWEQIREGI